MKIKNKKNLKLYNDLKSFIIKNYGKRCKDFYFTCYLCQCYLALDIIKDMMEGVDSENFIIQLKDHHKGK